MNYDIHAIALDDFCKLDDDQLMESPGVRLVSQEEENEHFYDKCSCVPLDQWRNITVELKKYSPNFENLDPLLHIGLFNLGGFKYEVQLSGRKKSQMR